MKIRYEILLPLEYNDGLKVEDELFDWTLNELVEKFGGVTFYSIPIKGLWIENNIMFGDKLVRICVDIEDTEENTEYFKRYKEKLKERFKQSEIWITAYNLRII